MPLKPLGHRVLVKPDEQPETSESGLIQLPQDRDHVACSGTVVAVGKGGSKVRWEARQRALRDALRALDENSVLWSRYGVAPLEIANTVLRLSGSPDPEREIRVGDRVVIPVEAGMNVSEDGVQYIIVNEDDLVIIVEESEEAA